MATFVLVHGAFQGGWVWQKTADLLRAHGHEVHTPTFAGCGYLWQEMQPKDDLNTYVNGLLRYLEFEDLHDIILVAHSFSGMICAAVMMRVPDRIQQALFVDAVIPEAHLSFAEIAGEGFRQILEKHRLEEWQVRPWPLQVFGVAESCADWFQSRLRPFPYYAFCTPFPETFDPAALSVSYIGCQETVTPFIREMVAKAKGYNWPVLELRTGHCPMVTCPSDLTRAIRSLITSDLTAQQ
jgi:pimeloyl-ACP methyl ester carboxylesterase